MTDQHIQGSSLRPFLKWAGGKTQLLGELKKRLPPELKEGAITKYVEPFIGGGAVFFSLTHNFLFRQCYLFDTNEELVLTYNVVKNSVEKLIAELEILEYGYLSGDDKERELFYYALRDSFNRSLPGFDFKKDNPVRVKRAAQIIFLNRTCYNGLFRLNRSGEFNVPFGRYKNPVILNRDGLRNAASSLKNARIIQGDFTACRKYVDDRTLVYFDPPYRPLTPTSSFTSYSKDGFSEDDQIRLAGFFRELDSQGAKIMLSNSDPWNENPGDTFFEDHYAGYTIDRVPAKRMINCNGSRRGDISELIITNYRG